MTVFNIVSRNRPPMQVEGEKVAEAIGSFHTMMVIETKDGYIGVLRMEYGNFNRQIASKGKNKTAMLHWLNRVLGSPRPKLVRDAFYNSYRNGLSEETVVDDLYDQIRSVIVQLEGE